MLPGERLYLQYRSDKPSLDALIRFQDLAYAANPQARRTLPEKFHITLLHFGILQEVFDELQQANRDLTWERYTAAVSQFVRKSQSQLPKSIRVQPEKMSMYGSRHEVLALKVIPDKPMIDAHRHAFEALCDFLKEVGIEYREAFMQGSRNLRFASRLNPHVTLLRSARTLVDIPKQDIELCFELLPVRYP